MKRTFVPALALALGGCLFWGGIPADELPDAPIAIHYRTSEQARKHAEALAEGAPSAPPTGGPRVVGSKAQLRADINVLGSFLSEALGLQPGAPELDRGRLALLDPRTGEVDVLRGALPGAIPLDWSSDHRRLLFAQVLDPVGGDVQIFEWDRGDDTVRRLTHAPPRHTQACRASGGSLVATAATGRGGDARSWIRISQPGGRGPWRDLSPGPADHSPTCAADGRTLAFVRSLEGGRSEIHVLEAPFVGASRRLARGHHPRFAGAGNWLVYAVSKARVSRLARVRADGSGRAPLGRGRGEEAWPAPSPDGAYVAYVATESYEEESVRHRLLVRRFDGSGDRVLLVRGEAEYPVW